MDDKSFEARVFDAVKNNLFAFKKILLGLDDCVPKNDFDAAQENLREAQTAIERLQVENSSLVNDRDELHKNLSQQEISLQQATEKISALTTELNDKISRIVESQEKISALTAELDEKSRRLVDCQQEISALTTELDEKSSRLVNCQQQISALTTELDEKSSRLDEFNANYSELEKIFAAYKKLSANTKFALEGVFGAEKAPTNFLAGALQDGHLEKLFDYVATALNSVNNPDELETLSNLCDFVFDAVNNGRREKIFARLDVRTGDDFDSATMRKTSDSAQSGTVKKILLVGYKYIRTGKAVKPSLVSLG